VENYKKFRKHGEADLIYMDVWSWWEVRAAQYVYPCLCTLIQLTNTWDGHSYLTHPHAGIEVEYHLYELLLKFGSTSCIALNTFHPSRFGTPGYHIGWQETLGTMKTYEREVDMRITELVLSNLNGFTTSEWDVDPHAIIISRPQALNKNDPRPHCSI